MQYFRILQIHNEMPSLWLLKSDISLLVHRPERGEQMYAQMYINMYKSTIFNTFTQYFYENIENLHKYWGFNTKTEKQRHIYPRQKILLWWIKPFMPKVGFWANIRKNPTKLRNYRQIKTLMECSTEIWHNFSKNLL